MVQSSSAMVTGGGAGIGREICMHLARERYSISVADLSLAAAEETAAMARGAGAGGALAIGCDVTKSDEMASAFRRHASAFGGLDVCVNNAGIEEKTGGGGESTNWRAVLEAALIDGTFRAIEAMRRSGQGGRIINVASTGGLYPMPYAPVYAASKAAVVMLCRSLGGLKKEGIHVAALCPQFTDTDLVQRQLRANPSYTKVVSGTQKKLLTVKDVAEGAMRLVQDPQSGGQVLRVTVAGGAQFCVPVNRAFASPPSKDERMRLLLEDVGDGAGADKPRSRL